MSAAIQPKVLSTVQAARAIAAIAVVLCHAGTILGMPRNIGYTPMAGIFAAGHAGVDFFFVLSGFIIATVHAGDIGRPRALGGYVWKRLVRIYPIYWIAVAIGVVATLFGLTGSVGFSLDDGYQAGPIIMSLALLPQSSPFFGVAWTLQHEMLFYAIFAILIVNRRLGTAAFVAWLSLSILVAIFGTLDRLPWAPASLLTGFLGSSYHLQFALGMMVSLSVVQRKLRFPRLTACVGAAVFLLTWAIENAGQIAYLGQAGRFLFGLSAAAMLAGIVTAERRGLLKAHRVAVFLGAASYSIYLIHVPTMAVLATLGHAATIPGWAFMILLSIGGVLAGVALHVAIERPVLRYLHRLTGRTGGVLAVMKNRPKLIRKAQETHRADDRKLAR
jgi:exopolysaccharide production protein ExoZ